MKYLKQMLIMFLLLAIPVLSNAAQDAKGSSDHPMFTRMPGALISKYEETAFGSFKFPVKPKPVTVEGRKLKIIYSIPRGENQYSKLQVSRNYANAIKQIGGEVLYENEQGTRVIMKYAKDQKEIWASVEPHNNPVNQIVFNLVEKGGMEQVIQSSEMLDALNKQGYISLDIHFDTGKATIKPESQSIVNEIIALLKANPKLNISVEGHTDNVGKADDNKSLSEARAKAVVAAIVKEGVDPKRLTAAGYGQERPVADNRSEEGRAKNRRVELVKK